MVATGYIQQLHYLFSQINIIIRRLLKDLYVQIQYLVRVRHFKANYISAITYLFSQNFSLIITKENYKNRITVIDEIAITRNEFVTEKKQSFINFLALADVMINKGLASFIQQVRYKCIYYSVCGELNFPHCFSK